MIFPAVNVAIGILKDAVVSGIAGNQANMAVVAGTRQSVYAVRCLLNNLKRLHTKENHILYRAMLTAHWQAIQQTGARYARINHIELNTNLDALPMPLRRVIDSFHFGEGFVTLRSASERAAMKALVAECDERIAKLRTGPPDVPSDWADALNSMFNDLTDLMAQNWAAVTGPAEATWRLLQTDFPDATACDGYHQLFVSNWYECFCVNFQILTKAPDVAPLLTGKLFAEIREREEASPIDPTTFVAALEDSIQAMLHGVEERIVAAVGESEKRTVHTVQQVGTDLGIRIDSLTEQMNTILRPGLQESSRGTGSAQPTDVNAPQSVATVMGSLPFYGNETIGRLTEVQEIAARVKSNRLVTILGAGGCGKTRVANEVARHLEPDFDRGVLFVDLSSLAKAEGEDSLVPSRIATLAGVREQVKRPPIDILAEYFRQGNTLLILDNCEHLIAPCVDTAKYLIPRCPGLRILATSRVPLPYAADHPYRLEPLAFPHFFDDITVDEAMRSPAVQLFVRRVQEKTPGDYSLDPSSAPSVARVCHALGGLPLAIEVAAGSLAVASVEQMGLNSLRLLDFLGEMKPENAREWDSLSAVFQWSCDLLGPEELSFMKALSVFDGGWNAEAAVGVCGGTELQGHAVLWHLRKLFDHSLVRTEDWNKTKRFRFYETMREFVQSKMTPAERKKYERRHAHYFAKLLDGHRQEFLGEHQNQALDLVQVDADNVRAAIRWAVANKDTKTALGIIAATWRFCEIRGYLTEGRERAHSVLSLQSSNEFPALRSSVLSGAGLLAFRQGDFRAAESMFKEAHELELSLENHAGVANALSDLALITHEYGDLERTIELQTRSLEIERRLAGDSALPVKQRAWHERQAAVLLNNMGSARAVEGKYSEAKVLLSDSAGLFRKLKNLRDCAFPLDHLANVAIYEADYPMAKTYADESLRIRRSLQDPKGVADTLRTRARLKIETRQHDFAKREIKASLLGAQSAADKKGIVECLGLFASLATQSGDFLHGVRLYAAAESERTGSHLAESWHSTRWRNRDMEATHAFFEDAQFNAEWEVGSKIPLAEALEIGAQIDTDSFA